MFEYTVAMLLYQRTRSLGAQYGSLYRACSTTTTTVISIHLLSCDDERASYVLMPLTDTTLL